MNEGNGALLLKIRLNRPGEKGGARVIKKKNCGTEKKKIQKKRGGGGWRVRLRNCSEMETRI